MKKIIYIFSFFLICLLAGCSAENEWNENYLPGTWKLEAVYLSSGGAPGSWKTVEDGYTYNFQNDGTFLSTRFEECAQGTFRIIANELLLDYSCESFRPEIENSEGILVEALKWEGKNMILVPKYLNCVEGCKYKFGKKALGD